MLTVNVVIILVVQDLDLEAVIQDGYAHYGVIWEVRDWVVEQEPALIEIIAINLKRNQLNQEHALVLRVFAATELVTAMKMKILASQTVQKRYFAATELVQVMKVQLLAVKIASLLNLKAECGYFG